MEKRREVILENEHLFCDNCGLANAGVAQLVERNLAKVEVESSRLFSRSSYKRQYVTVLPFFVGVTYSVQISPAQALVDQPFSSAIQRPWQCASKSPEVIHVRCGQVC